MWTTGATVITDLIQLIYVSQPFGYDSATLAGILLDARNHNTRDGITGALVCRHDIYLQLLEGPADQVNAAYARILRDDRHVGIKELVRRDVTQRIFGDWAMLHDPEVSWIWSREDIADGQLDRATPADVVDVFTRLSAKVQTDAST